MSGRQQPVVAIDGPAGAGKSTAARMLAARLGYLLVDTGAIYRGVTLAADEAGVSWSDGPGLGALAQGLAFHFESDGDGTPRLHLDGRDRSGEIRTPHVSKGASQVSAHSEVRTALLELQRRLGRAGGVVLEGRDIGTVVFPDAEVKVFLTASDAARAQRRHAELTSRGSAPPYERVLSEIRTRDRRDSSRDIAPLRAAEDAVHLDTSGLELEQVVERLLQIVTERTAVPGR